MNVIGMTLQEACAQDYDWQRLKDWGPACAAGACRYASAQDTPKVEDAIQRWLAPLVSAGLVSSTARPGVTCSGWRVTPSLEGAPYLVLRWGMCPRHTAWWAVERLRRKAARATAASEFEQGRRGGPIRHPAGWRED